MLHHKIAIVPSTVYVACSLIRCLQQNLNVICMMSGFFYHLNHLRFQNPCPNHSAKKEMAHLVLPMPNTSLHLIQHDGKINVLTNSL